ncbi:MAG: S4 domain-containing protein [Sphingomonadales bacterium]
MADALRLDLFLWFARISSSRTFAQDLASKGHLRIDGRVVGKSAAPVRVGNVLTFANHRGEVRSLRVEALPVRRGPPEEAQTCYTDLIDAARPPT